MRLNVKSILPIIAALITLIMAVACGHRPTRDALERADALIDEHADSALAVLQTIDTTRLSGRRDRALYGLLMTQALVKLHRPVTSDSLIAPAARYFAASSDRHHAMRAIYYHGVVVYDNGRNSDAIMKFFKARDLANELNDHFWAGLACRGISDIYNESYDKAEELKYAKEEYEHFLKSGRWLYIRYAKLDLARAHASNANFDTSNILARELLDTAKCIDDDNLLCGAYRLHGTNYLALNSPDKALPFLEKLCATEYADADDYAMWALALTGSGNPSRALQILNSSDIAEEGFNQYVRYRTYCGLGLDKAALSTVDEFIYNKSNALYDRMSCPITNSVEGYYAATCDKTKSDLKVARLRLWLIVSIALCLISWLIHFAHSHIHKQKKQIEEKIQMAEQLHALLSQSYSEHAQTQEEYAEVQNQCNKIQVQYNRMQKEIIELFASKYEFLQDVCHTYYTSKDTVTARKLIATKVTTLIERLSKEDKILKELEDEIDLRCDNLFHDFREAFPNLKKDDYKVFLFSILKFSSSLVASITGVRNVLAVYNRRRRLKDKITQSDIQGKERFLAVLD